MRGIDYATHFLMRKNTFKGGVNMNSSLLELIYDYYSGYLNHEFDEETEEEIKFRKKYIEPLSKQNSKKGIKMDDMFNAALSECEVQSFKKGFRTCMHFIIEYIKSDL